MDNGSAHHHADNHIGKWGKVGVFLHHQGQANHNAALRDQPTN